MKTGLIGATGRVGGITLRHLLADPDLQVTAAGRDLERVRGVLPVGEGGRLVAAKLDIQNPDGLDSFCAAHDLVINCAGPSGRILDTVIAAALRNGTPVIDPGGYDPVLQRLKTLGEGAAAPVVVGAGLLPGLSGIFPRMLVEAAGGEAKRLDVFYAGTDAWSHASAWDIIQSVGDFGAERPPSYVADGAITSVPMRRAFRELTLPEPVGKVKGFMLYTEEIGRLAKRAGIPEARCHGVNNGFWSGIVLMIVKLARLHRTDSQVGRSARWLALASERDRRNGQKPCFAIDCRVTLSDAREHHAQIVTGDTYEGTGAVLATAARLLLREMPHRRRQAARVGMMHEVLDPQAFLDLFRTTGCILSEARNPC